MSDTTKPSLESTRMPERMVQDRTALDALLDSTILAHVAFVGDDGLPGVLPTAIARWGDDIVVHGSTGSRWMRLVIGAPATVSIAVADGVVVARSSFESGLMYRSAVLFGHFRKLSGTAETTALEILSNRIIPGRVAELRASSKKELAATLTLAMPIEHWSLRAADAWPEDDDQDVASDAWAGQIRFGPRPITIHDSPDLREGIKPPASVTGFAWKH